MRFNRLFIVPWALVTIAAAAAPPEGGQSAGGAFAITNVDPGDRAWGQNLLHVTVENTTDSEQPFWLGIGGRYTPSGHPRGFGMGLDEAIVLRAREKRTVELAYWIPPQLGQLQYNVKCVRPTAGPPPWEQEPFFKKSDSVTFETPNRRCNELTPLSRFTGEDWAEKYRQGAKIPPFEVATTKHFVFYVLPDSPASKALQAIESEREKILGELCAFFGVSVSEPINCFLFPDAPSKRWCMAHQGDGLAFDTTIAEIYTEQKHLDPAHELAHIVAGQIGEPPALFNEGFAVYTQADHPWHDTPVDQSAAKLLREKKLAPLAKLIRRTEIGSQEDDGEIAYPESASFVKFIIDTYGRERFIKLYGRLENGAKDNGARFKEVLGVDLGAAEQAWHTALRALKG